MRQFIIIGLAIAGLGLTACSKEDQKQVNEGASVAADKTADAAKDIVSDPQVKEAGSAIADAAKDDANAVKDVVQDAADKTSDAADKAADKVKAKADDAKAKDEAKK
jgi:hypothetical protein